MYRKLYCKLAQFASAYACILLSFAFEKSTVIDNSKSQERFIHGQLMYKKHAPIPPAMPLATSYLKLRLVRKTPPVKDQRRLFESISKHFLYGHPFPKAFKNALTSKKSNCPSPLKSAIGSIELIALRNALTSKKSSWPSPVKSAGHEPDPHEAP